ncbi:uncharacterized protein TRIVIDRAFT_62005 [Trichoderma virens Gv29-8]|uniref:Uncharacterized protein n=1 Tax=Hypocrea virens (strain Gv29-8 / FGSC 10586) TaxID=413071 RepID=G9MIJ6_HYPVG|nr:uncharacterized protein TRIVIDRAFT_62005 [Trichoderma virens Gv29-8]EHK25313.1 hypothetical protein TRIVIDRAFT_62005 [Trichoderma virens Gv29-8]UKZ48864.1 hypothetical protein TrVGV298_003100 [Trichoderma virens]
MENSNGMAAYEQLQGEPVSSELFHNRITTMQGLLNALEDSAFIEIDTEHIPICKICLQELTSHIFNINLVKEKQDEIIRLRGKGGVPTRRRHRFGREQQVDLENLEGAIVDFIQGCDSKANLVLIGFEMAAEWTYLSRNFPQAIPFFSAWVDLRDIAKDVTSSVGIIPGLVSLLKIFGYHWKDLQPGRKNLTDGIADNAGDDAVATCALANALLDSGNQEKLKFRRECGRIARISTKKKGF